MAFAPPVYTFQRGEPVTLALRVDASDLSAAQLAALTVAAAMKPVPANSFEPPADSVPVSATFVTGFVPAANGAAAYWTLVLTAVQTAALDAGRYLADAKFSSGGTVISRTSPAAIVLKNKVTP